jgi:enamine deaminase RidA (YjgF/YER057c/UK114 family)
VRNVGGIVYVSAHAGYLNGQLVYPGVAGEDVTLEQAGQSAAIAALNGLESVQELIGLDRVAEVVQMTGHIACVRNYEGLRDVMHEASAVVNEVFAVTGRHARTTLGAYALPQGASVVIEMILTLKGSGRG